MKRSFLRKIFKISSCFSILTIPTVNCSFSGSFIENSLSTQIRELNETLRLISDNERLDYPEKNSVYKKIDQLTQNLLR